MVETAAISLGIVTSVASILVLPWLSWYMLESFCMVVFVGACCDGDFTSASQVLDAAMLTPADITSFVTSSHPSDSYSLLYRLA